MSSGKQAVARFVRRKIQWLDSVDEDAAGARAALATLRRGVGKAPAELPEVWAITMTWEGEDGADETADSRTEWAAHVALTLYALHRQGKSESMSDAASSFGAAMGMLRRNDPDKSPGVVRRFNAAVTSEDLAEFSRHAQSAVQLLRASEHAAKIDYPAFAADLFDYQFPSRRDRVVLNWGRDFWREYADNNHNAEGAE
jgi:CRISPR system Cascade subunit CasB